MLLNIPYMDPMGDINHQEKPVGDIGLPRRRFLGQELLLLRFRHLHRFLLQVLEKDGSATRKDVNLETHWKENHGNHKCFFLHSDVFCWFFLKVQWIIPPNGHVLRGKILLRSICVSVMKSFMTKFKH
jgi:hypothetical protein